MTVRIGTSGWLYRDWRGVLYPPGLPQARWFEHLLTGFQTTELNVTFYRLPAAEVFEGWRRRSPPDALIAVKASRYLTHVRRLAEPAAPVERLMARAQRLGDRLGPVLIQLPPDLAAEPARLADTLAAFPPGLRLAVEPRHPSWWTDAVRQLLTDHGAALVWADRRGRPVAPLWRTAGFGYLRLHHGTAAPPPRYGRRALASWAQRLAAAFPPPAEAFVYFNNDPGGAAVRDAAAFARELDRIGLPRTRVPSLPPAGRPPPAAGSVT